jgi:hypothetical protein
MNTMNNQHAGRVQTTYRVAAKRQAERFLDPIPAPLQARHILASLSTPHGMGQKRG